MLEILFLRSMRPFGNFIFKTMHFRSHKVCPDTLRLASTSLKSFNNVCNAHGCIHVRLLRCISSIHAIKLLDCTQPVPYRNIASFLSRPSHNLRQPHHSLISFNHRLTVCPLPQLLNESQNVIIFRKSARVAPHCRLTLPRAIKRPAIRRALLLPLCYKPSKFPLSLRYLFLLHGILFCT